MWYLSAATHEHVAGRFETRFAGIKALLDAKVALPDALRSEYGRLTAASSMETATSLDEDDEDEDEAEVEPAAPAAASPADDVLASNKKILRRGKTSVHKMILAFQRAQSLSWTYRSAQSAEVSKALAPQKLKIVHLKIFRSEQHHGTLARLQSLNIDENDFEPGLWRLALRRFAFDLRGMKRQLGDKNIMVVALRDKHVVGFLLMSTVNNRLTQNPAELDGCITWEVNITSVSEKQRRIGIGAQIAKKIILIVQRMLDEDTPLGYLLVKSTPEAQKFWKAMGFSKERPFALVEATPYMETSLDNAGYNYYMELEWDAE